MPSPILPRVPGSPTKNLTAQNWVPVSYSAKVTGLSAGETLPLQQATLQSGFNTPYFIDEIRFMAYTATSFTGSPVNYNLSLITNFQLGCGRYQFSKGNRSQTPYVPMALFAPQYAGGISGSLDPQDNGQTLDNNNRRNYSTRRWVLPKPLYMPAGDTIQASVSRDATLGSSLPDFTVWVTVIGRALPPHTPPPPTRCVPHVGFFVQPSSVTYAEANNLFLNNPYNTPWNVQRIILASVYGDATHAIGQYGFYYDSTGGESYTQLKLADSLGYKITGGAGGGFVPMGDVASWVNNAAWTFSRSLPPNAYYTASFNTIVGSSPTASSYSPMISLVGYREEL